MPKHDIPEGEKWCWNCGRSKLIEEFGPNRGKPDGLQDACKPCQKLLGEKRRRKDASLRALGRSVQEEARLDPYNIEEVEAFGWAEDYTNRMIWGKKD